MYPTYSQYFPLAEDPKGEADSIAAAASTTTTTTTTGSPASSPTQTKEPAVICQSVYGTQVFETNIPSITIVGTALVPEGTFVEYSIMLHCGKVACQMLKRFSELEKVHKALKGIVSPLPPFPPKRRLRGKHMVSPINVALRAAELQKYFDELVRTPGVLATDAFYKALGLGDGSGSPSDVTQAERVKALFLQYGHLQLGDQLRQPKKSTPGPQPLGSPAQTRRADTHQSKPKKVQKNQVEMDHDFFYSQRFHILAKKMQSVPRGVRDSDEGFSDDEMDDDDVAVPIPALFFTHSLQFFINKDFWKSDRTIREDVDGRSWFSMVGPVPSVAVGKNPRASDYFAIINAAASVPLMFISFADAKKTSYAWEAMTDGTVGAMIYSIQVVAESDAKQKTFKLTSPDDSAARHDVVCKGQWPVVSLKEPEDSKASVIVEEWGEDLLSIEVKPHHDIIFYLAYLISIARLQQM